MGKSGLKVTFVRDLEEIVAPVSQFLGDGRIGLDPFEKQYLIVPTAGVRAWLTPMLAKTFGADPSIGDGIFSNVDVGYIGMLQTIIRKSLGEESDAWSIESLTLATLRALHEFGEKGEKLKIKYNGYLHAARILGDRFDRYAARRPDLIRSWEAGEPALGDIPKEQSQWQFDLWTRVREIIGVSPWPVVVRNFCDQLEQGHRPENLPTRLMIAGLETISPANLELIESMSHVMEIDLLFVHQSPDLANTWKTAMGNIVPNAKEMPVRDHFQMSQAGIASLPSEWMLGSFDLQLLLASRGIPFTATGSNASETTDGTFLAELQTAIAYPSQAKQIVISDQNDAQRNPRAKDLSVQIHRAHSLGRQIEVLHDALLHAFENLENLQPHEVLVLCADIQSASPLLEAAFSQAVKAKNGKNSAIPLMIADRSLHDVSSGAVLLGNLLAMGSSRFDVESVLAVVADDLVLKNKRVSQVDIAVWHRHLEMSRLRWGLDVQQRSAKGLHAPELTVHTWLDSIERSIIGALTPELTVDDHAVGGVDPLPFGDTSTLSSLDRLVDVMSIVAELEFSTRQKLPVPSWCDIVEKAIVDLCGESCTDIDEALLVLDEYRSASLTVQGINGAEDLVEFGEFADLVQTRLETSPGRQSLRTGAVIATSFVPLRTVPYRVICVVGLDDGTLPSGDAEGDDLVALTPMIGDADPRIEIRRVLLDALTASRERFIVTCNGKSIKNNKAVPLVTPLAEFLDHCKKFGIYVPDDSDKPSDLEYVHPRHKGSPKNFSKDISPVPGDIWSFDETALTVAQLSQKELANENVSPKVDVERNLPEVVLASEISISDLEQLAIDPLDYYLRKSWSIFPDYEDGKTESDLPLEATDFQFRNACMRVLEEGISSTDFEITDEFSIEDAKKEELESTRKLFRKEDIFPVSHLAEKLVKRGNSLVSDYRKMIKEAGITSPLSTSLKVEMSIDENTTISGDLKGLHLENSCISIVSFSEKYENDVVRMTIRLLICRALNLGVTSAVMVHLSGSGKPIKRVIKISDDLTPEKAHDRLRDLVSVEPLARAIACPQFGKTSSSMLKVGSMNVTIADVAAIFDEFVDGFTFGYSKEQVVFGPQPDFTIVYKNRWSILIHFFSIFTRATAVVDTNTSPKGWVLQP
jgi:exodeoxyribonuclease V gamma subunit